MKGLDEMLTNDVEMGKYPTGTCTTTQNAVILLQIVMVSPGTHLVENHESQSRTTEPQFKKQ